MPENDQQDTQDLPWVADRPMRPPQFVQPGDLEQEERIAEARRNARSTRKAQERKAADEHKASATRNEPEAFDDQSKTLKYVMWIVGTIIVFAFMSYIAAAQLPAGTPHWVVVAMVATIFLIPALQAAKTIQTALKQAPSAGQLAIPYDPRFVKVGTGARRRVRRLLLFDETEPDLSEQKIHILIRRHKAEALIGSDWAFWSTFAIIGIVVLAAVSITGVIPGAQIVPWYVWLLLLLIPGYRMGLSWLNWWDKYLMVTDKNIVLVTLPPAFLWWRKKNNPRLPLNSVQFANSPDQGKVGNLIGYGELEVDGFSALDVDLNKLTFIGDHVEIGNQISLLLSK